MWSSGYDFRLWGARSCVRISRTTCLIFLLENILRSNLNFSTSYGRLTDLKSVLGLFLVSFIWLWVKFHFTKILTYRRGTFVPPCLDGHRSCPEWLNSTFFASLARFSYLIINFRVFIIYNNKIVVIFRPSFEYCFKTWKYFISWTFA